MRFYPLDTLDAVCEMGCAKVLARLMREPQKSMQHNPGFDGTTGPDQDAKQAALAEHLFSTLSAAVPDGRNVVLWDYPVYANVGDIAIYLGTEAWLQRHSFRVLDRRSMENFREISLDAETIILLQGGGNFGDLYNHQVFREQIVSTYPNNRIVFLPQTLHFRDTRIRAEAGKVLNSHPDLHLILRDSRSFDFAGEVFDACHRHLAPDMAVALYPLRTSLGLTAGHDHAHTGELYLLRTDRESGGSIEVPDARRGRTTDWHGMLGSPRVSMIRLAARLHRHARLMPASLLATGWYDYSLRVLRHCTRVMARSDRIVTDRLHGHILATMLGIPNVLLDNSYGKNRRYFETWHDDIEIVRFADGDLDLCAGLESETNG